MFSPRLRARFEREREENAHLTKEFKEELKAKYSAGKVFVDEPMSTKSALGVGGNADVFAVADNIDELKFLLGWVMERNSEYHFMGAATKTVVRDGGIPGLVISLGSDFCSIKVESESSGDVFVSVGGAVKVRDLVSWCVESGISGAEWMLTLRGTVGGCIMTGKSEGEGSVLNMLEELTIVNKEQKELTLKEKGLRLEDGKLKVPRTACIVKALMKLKKDDVANVAKKVDDIVKNIPTEFSDANKFISGVFMGTPKMSAESLIEDAGLKGIRIGGARISKFNANTIVNEGNATATNVGVLMDLVRDRVRQDTGMPLETRVHVVGEKRK